MEVEMSETARILNGVEIAAEIKAEVADEVRALKAAGVTPGLAVVLVGHVAASEIYVRSKVKACAELGICERDADAAGIRDDRRDAGADRRV